ncbi:DNA repair protein RAD51 homolog 4 isoform X3 [Gadus morhua]|uniref:DNA repair protein RAD51 homolog 4 isoform X3 n=1 Tax=Gadus morhua TaxID=8049 RepID=UPI0011B7D275|nr:DNA repair protein RAD51 homolog 4 isoform X3 [Gadus morhua]
MMKSINNGCSERRHVPWAGRKHCPRFACCQHYHSQIPLLFTVEDLVASDSEELAQKCSLSYKALLAIRRVLLAQHTAFPVSGADLYEELLSSTAIVSTSIPSLDKLLDSGLYTGEITELSGGPGTGKSQMEALQRIRVFRVFDIFSLLGCLHTIRCGGPQQASLGAGSVKAVIVDSVSAIISPTLGGKQNEGMSLMMQVAGALKTIAKDFNVAVLVTNHVTRGAGGELQAGLGLTWSHVPRTRLLLERSRGPGPLLGSTRTATLVKSSRQPCHIKAQFDLNWGSGSEEGLPGRKRARDSSDS